MKAPARLLAVGLIIWCGVSLPGGAAVPRQDRDRPIPQDPKKQEERTRDRLAWQRKTLAEAYIRVGHKGPAWDEDAREALDIMARVASQEFVSRDEQWKAVTLCRRATASGCDDPLVATLEAVVSKEFVEPNSKENLRRLLPAVAALEQSPYPAIRKVWGLRHAVAGASTLATSTPEEKRGIGPNVDGMLKWLGISLAEEPRSPDTESQWFQALVALIQGRRALNNDVDAALAWVEEQVERMPDLRVCYLQARCSFMRKYAWEALGNGYSVTVTEDGWRKMATRLGDAKRSIDQAWALRPGSSLTAYEKLATMLGMDETRDEMERWFRTAMEADGNNLAACRSKMSWLEPKWHGSDADLIDFGRLCGDTRNWRAGISLLEPECYLLATSDPGEPPSGRLWESPETWQRCRDIFDEYLARQPNDATQRTRYAVIAALTGHHAEAVEQFAQLGENVTFAANMGMTRDWVRSVRDDSIRKVEQAKAPH